MSEESSSRDLLNPSQSSEDSIISLRPKSFRDYIGQTNIKENLEIAVKASITRNEALDHILLHGPPGLGKTSLSYLVATEMGVGFKSTSGPAIEKTGDLVALLSSLNSKDVIFIDEIHRLPRVVEETLYPAMEDRKVDILIGHGPSARAVEVSLPEFTLIGATTRTSLLTSPLRDRFGISFRLEFYNQEELSKIILRSAKILNLSITEDAALEIGRRSRGTPRIANRLLKRVRDFAEVTAEGSANISVVRRALTALEIDEHGLDTMDRDILSTIIEKFNGGPVGLQTIAASIGEDSDTLMDVYEPFLLRKGFIARTPRGRVITELGTKWISKAI